MKNGALHCLDFAMSILDVKVTFLLVNSATLFNCISYRNIKIKGVILHLNK